MSKLRPLLKTHGGKFYLAQWIISHFPDNYHQLNYLEPFAGGANVFLQKTPSQVEWLNDLHEDTMQVYSQAQSERDAFHDILCGLEYKQETFDFYKNAHFESDPLLRAVQEVVLRRFSRGGMGDKFAWSDRMRGGQPGDVNSWATFRAQLPDILDRFQHVNLCCTDAVNLIPDEDSDSLIYCDPPYLHSTRTTRKAYHHEMAEDQHVKLAEVLNRSKAYVVLSGYPSELYDQLYSRWRRVDKPIANHASYAKRKAIKTECLWLNY